METKREEILEKVHQLVGEARKELAKLIEPVTGKCDDFVGSVDNNLIDIEDAFLNRDDED